MLHCNIIVYQWSFIKILSIFSILQASLAVLFPYFSEIRTKNLLWKYLDLDGATLTVTNYWKLLLKGQNFSVHPSWKNLKYVASTKNINSFTVYFLSFDKWVIIFFYLSIVHDFRKCVSVKDVGRSWEQSTNVTQTKTNVWKLLYRKWKSCS